MDSDPISEFWIDDVGDGELRCALESFCDMPPTTNGNGSGFQEEPSSRKRGRDESCSGPKSKACREKMRRDRLNDRFVELSSVLDPGRPPRSDKGSILSDAARLLVQLKTEAEELKETNEKLQETIKELKVEKNELRDEKMRIKTDTERSEQQLNAMSAHPPPPAFISHPMLLHHPPAPAHSSQHSSFKSAPLGAYPAVQMWQWLPPAVLDTTQDLKLWSPNA